MCMKAVVVVDAAIAFASVAALGQGQFLFNTRDLSIGNNISFVGPNCIPASGSDLFVEVLAGPSNCIPEFPSLILCLVGLTGLLCAFARPALRAGTHSG